MRRLAGGVCDLGDSGLADAGQVDRDDNIVHLPSPSALIARGPETGPAPASTTGSADHRTRGEWPNCLVALF